jgi:tyrosyl-tRNA synthetase
MGFIDELRWRGMLNDMTPDTEQYLNSGQRIGYIGFDPTAPSMTIGNFVQLQLLKLFQLSGHKPIVLMGGATGRIGDPSGKDKERQLKTENELDSNLHFQLKQAKKFLDFEGENSAIVVNNLDFYKDMNVLEFLRKVGKTLTVNYMMSKDSVKNRLETGLSFTEFSYQLLQAYDFQCLYEKYNCTVQMGGSDQWGNITSGTEFIRRNLENAKAYAVTTPLLTKSDGKKFGKSEQGNLWLDPNLTSPYAFYQFWINADDADISSFMRYFTLKSEEEVKQLEIQYKEDIRGLKEILAEELTARVHSLEALSAVRDVSQIIFNKKLTKDALQVMNEATFEAIGSEITTYKIDTVKSDVVTLLTESCPIFSSKSEAKRAIKNNAVSLNKDKVYDENLLVNNNDLIHDKYLFIENGKKNKFLLILDN